MDTGIKNRKKANFKNKKEKEIATPIVNPIFFEDDQFIYGMHNRLIYIIDVKDKTTRTQV